MFTVVDSKTLILPADKDSRDQIASNKECQKPMMQPGISTSSEDGQADKPDSANRSKDNREPSQDLLHKGPVGHEATAVSQPSFREESSIKEDGGENASGDEERPQTVSADVGNVCDIGVARLSRISTTVLVDLPFKQETQKHAQPY